MTEQDAKIKANVIYDLLENIATGHMYYCEVSGTLNFNFRIPSAFGYLKCAVTPAKDKYKIKVTYGVNIATTLILYEVDGISVDNLNNTMVNIIEYLDKEWLEFTKDKEHKGWWNYPKAKVIKYDDHGYVISAG